MNRRSHMRAVGYVLAAAYTVTYIVCLALTVPT